MNGTRFSREEAREALRRFLMHVQGINSDVNHPLYIRHVVGYGSYFATERERVGDVDLAIDLGYKPKVADTRRSLTLLVQSFGGSATWNPPALRDINTDHSILSLSRYGPGRWDPVEAVVLVSEGVFVPPLMAAVPAVLAT